MGNNNNDKEILNQLEKEDVKFKDGRKKNKMSPYKRDRTRIDYEAECEDAEYHEDTGLDHEEDDARDG
jgi:hypothetical protein